MLKVVPARRCEYWIPKNFGGIGYGLVFENMFRQIMGFCIEGGEDKHYDYFEDEDNSDIKLMKIHTNSKKKFHVICETNFYDGMMSGEAICIGVMLVCLNYMVWHLHNRDENVSRMFNARFYALRELALTHSEATEIFKFID